MKVFSVIGVSQSGKTTTVERIITELRNRGYRVGSIKDIHFEGFFLDTVGSNTWRHRQAGSELVVARGLAETDVLIPQQIGIDQILSFFNHDYVVVEGVYDTLLPKIICASNYEEIDERMNELVFAISGCISNKVTDYKGIPIINALTDVGKLVNLIEAKVPKKLPHIYSIDSCKACGSNCRGLMAKIINGEATPEECIYFSNRVSVTIGKNELPVDHSLQSKIKCFVEENLAKLDGYDSKNDIKIVIRK